MKSATQYAIDRIRQMAPPTGDARRAMMDERLSPMAAQMTTPNDPLLDFYSVLLNERGADGQRPLGPTMPEQMAEINALMPRDGNTTQNLMAGAENFMDSGIAPGFGMMGTVGKVGDMIQSPAIRIGYETFTGINHAAALDEASRRLGVSADELLRRSDVDIDGFVTDTGRYVDRRTAASIADAAEQTPYDDIIPGRELVAEDLSPDAEFASLETRLLMQGNALSGVADDVGITAYHGSPHTFDKFRWDDTTRGTGEGAQAYGDGLYFAESEGVARQYRDNLSPQRRLGNAQQTELRRLRELIDLDEADLASIDNGNPQGFLKVDAESMRQDIARNKERLAKVESLNIEPDGSMYQVRLNASPDDFLDWDKPLSEQPQGVRRQLGLDDVDPEHIESALGVPLGKPLDELTGAEYLRSFGQQRYASDYLSGNVVRGFRNQDGNIVNDRPNIPGLRYFDGNSRGVGEGTSNYVVWDDSIIEILKRYGLIPPVAVGAGLLSNDEAEAGQ